MMGFINDNFLDQFSTSHLTGHDILIFTSIGEKKNTAEELVYLG